MDKTTEQARLDALAAKGGVMFFTIEKPDQIYWGAVYLSAAQTRHRVRVVCMRKHQFGGP